ncbi:MAG: FecR family protein [Tannerellaceae bacterium]|nr:FecR family protein [Tannerellaceae bacterium]
MKNETLYKYFEGVASFEEEEKIREWLKASEKNQKQFLQERKLFNALVLFADKNRKEIPEFSYRKHNRSFYLRELLKVAAIMTIAFSLGYFLSINKTEETEEPLFMQTITVPDGQRIQVSLPDGTKVWLNTRTEFSYPVHLATGKRFAHLSGEAYFEVSKNEQNPFTVYTSKGTIEVLGTHFNVQDYPDQDLFETTLMEGSVKVSSHSDPEESILIQPNQKAFLADGKLIVNQVNDFDPYSWKNGLISFTEIPFEAVMKEFEKYYGKQIIVKNRNIKNYSYTGKFRLSDGLEYALRVLQEDIYFRYSRDSENQVITIE